MVLNYAFHRFERSTTIGMSQGKFDMKGLQSDSSHFHFLLLKHWVSNSFSFFDSLGCYLLAFKSTQWHAVGPRSEVPGDDFETSVVPPPPFAVVTPLRSTHPSPLTLTLGVRARPRHVTELLALVALEIEAVKSFHRQY